MDDLKDIRQKVKNHLLKYLKIASLLGEEMAVGYEDAGQRASLQRLLTTQAVRAGRSPRELSPEVESSAPKYRDRLDVLAWYLGQNLADLKDNSQRDGPAEVA